MKALMIIMCFFLVGMFVYDFKKVNTPDGWKAFIRVSIDAFLIIVFAILERGRW